MCPTANSPKVIIRARRLRKTMTEGERRLWSALKEFRRDFGVHFRKQAPIDPYVVDFVSHEHRLVVEVDGEHHFTPEGLRRDLIRDQYLHSRGYRVIRLSTGDLHDGFNGCVEEIMGALGLMRGSDVGINH
jgi:very-short-patch-repair endonuclease